MCQSLLAAEKVGSGKKVDVVIQLARYRRTGVQLIRPLEQFAAIDGNWAGVRRYYVRRRPKNHPACRFHSSLQADLGKINMADPAQLASFICWAKSAYPAKRYLLLLSGHGYLYLGCSTDFTQPRAPYILGIRQAGHVIRQYAPDLTVLDTCYSNHVEVLNELAGEIILTYPGRGGPTQGIDYSPFLELLSRDKGRNLFHLARQLAGALGMVAVRLAPGNMEDIKGIVNEIGTDLLKSEGGAKEVEGSIASFANRSKP